MSMRPFSSRTLPEGRFLSTPNDEYASVYLYWNLHSEAGEGMHGDITDQMRQDLSEQVTHGHTGYASRLCPGCREQRLRRIHRPLHWRLLRIIGVHRWRYRCESCQKVWDLSPRV
jgi:hypothetical protein